VSFHRPLSTVVWITTSNLHRGFVVVIFAGPADPAQQEFRTDDANIAGENALLMSLRIDIRMEEVLRASLTCGKEGIQYVCVGDDSDKAVCRRDRQTSDLAMAHQPGGIHEGIVRADGDDVRVHDR